MGRPCAHLRLRVVVVVGDPLGVGVVGGVLQIEIGVQQPAVEDPLLVEAHVQLHERRLARAVHRAEHRVVLVGDAVEHAADDRRLGVAAHVAEARGDPPVARQIVGGHRGQDVRLVEVEQAPVASGPSRGAPNGTACRRSSRRTRRRARGAPPPRARSPARDRRCRSSPAPRRRCRPAWRRSGSPGSRGACRSRSRRRSSRAAASTRRPSARWMARSALRFGLPKAGSVSSTFGGWW